MPQSGTTADPGESARAGRRNRMLCPAPASGTGLDRGCRSGRRQRRQGIAFRADRFDAKQGRDRRSRLRGRRADLVFRRVLDRGQDPLVPESAGRLRLSLQLLHDPAGAGRKPQPADRRSGRRGGTYCGRRPARNRADGNQYGRLRQNDRRAVRRFAAGARRGSRDRSLPDLVDRAESAFRRSHRVHGRFGEVSTSFPHSDTKRLRPDSWV